MKQVLILCLFLCCFIGVNAKESNYQIYFYNEEKALIKEGKVEVKNKNYYQIYEIKQGKIVLQSLPQDYYEINLLDHKYQDQIHQIYIHENKQMECKLYYEVKKEIKEDYSLIYFYIGVLVLLFLILGNLYINQKIKDHS